MSRIPMAVASTLVVLAALGVAHLIVFRTSSMVAEAAPPEVIPAVAGGETWTVPQIGGHNHGPTSRQASFAVHALYSKARAQIQTQTRGPQTIRVCSSEAAEGCAGHMQAASACICAACTGECSADCQAECGWWIYAGNRPMILKVFRGVAVEEECCCEDGENCKGCAAQFANTASKGPRSEVARRIDEFEAADEFPLGQIVAGFGTWFRCGEGECCPLCPSGQTCPACKNACECPAVAAAPKCGSSGIGAGVASCVKGTCAATRPACRATKATDRDNCPGAELEGQAQPNSAKEAMRDRDLADQISQIEEIRRERNHLLQGTLLESSDEEDRDFGDALRLVAGFVEGEAAPLPPPGAIVPPGVGQSGPFPQEFGAPEQHGAADPALVDVLRHASRLLDHRSHDLEDTGRYEEADHLRALAQAIRHEARKAGSASGEGGCGLFCPAAAAKAMCAPTTERTARRPGPVTKDGPVETHY